MSDREKRLIDANELKDSFGFLRKMWSETEICGIIDAMPTADVTVQKWIPVSERLPQEDEPKTVECDIVQILLDDITVTVGWCNRWEEKWYIVAAGEDDFSAVKFGSDFIVAWKPLAEPPKECE